MKPTRGVGDLHFKLSNICRYTVELTALEHRRVLKQRWWTLSLLGVRYTSEISYQQEVVTTVLVSPVPPARGNEIYRMLKKRVTGSLKWIKSPGQHKSRNQRLLRYGWCSCDLYSKCSMWIPYISTQLSALRRTEVSTLSKIPGFTRLSRQAFFTRCCNTSKSLIGAEVTEVFRCLYGKKSRVLRSGDRAGQLTVHWKCGENKVMLHHAWTTCVVFDEEAHVPRVLVNHSTKTMVHCTC
jgi:hypothetical protein